MNANHLAARPSTTRNFLFWLAQGVVAGACVVLAACGGSADAPPPPETAPVVPPAVPPSITLQPVSQSVTTGQPVSFSVAASGTAPITYQWERNGTAITGANSTSYSIATTAMSDSGAVFSAVATNVAGSATSENANLTVTAAPPVLTITQQPASLTVVAGTTATFTVGATCSSGTLDIQWRRTDHFDIDPFVDIAGATSASYSLMTSAPDGSVFVAVLDCSGQSTTMSAFATLTVTSPSSVTLSLLPLTGLRAQADVHNPGAIVEDNQNSYSFIASNRIKRLSADLTTITTVAGSGVVGSADGPGQTATFQGPAGITRDASGTLYVTDNLTIRRITADGTVTTLAGSANQFGLTDGTGAAARFYGPFGIAIGPDGDLYVADTVSVRRVTSAGVVTTYAGGGGTLAGLGGPAATVQFAALTGIAVSPTGDVYVSDSILNRIFLIARVGGIDGTAGNVSAIAGDGTDNETDGVGTLAQIGRPTTMCMSGGALYVADESFSIRKIDVATLAVTTFAGASTAPHGEIIDGPVGVARFRVPGGLAASTLGGLLLTDSFTIRHIDATGTAVTIAMSTVEDVDAVGQGTLMQLPFNATNGAPGLVVEPGQSVVVSTETLLRRISPTGVVTLIAGLPAIPAIAGDGAIDGNASRAQFGEIAPPLVRDSTGTVYVGDLFGVRKVTTDGTVSFIAGSAADHTRASRRQRQRGEFQRSNGHRDWPERRPVCQRSL